MPELPEVETVRQELAPLVNGRRIVALELPVPKMVAPDVANFRQNVIGKRIVSVGRRGKYLILELSGNGYLVIHLKMSGALIVGKEPPQYARAIIALDNGQNIYFRDPRKFGRLRYVDDIKSITDALGPEPLEKKFTPAVLGRRLASHRSPIKAVLLDQGVLAGVGNMYADESLFEARIHPLRPANSLTPEDVRRLHKAIRQVLARAIERKGASVAQYFRPGGGKGQAQLEFQVAHRRGEQCPVCGGPVERLCIRGRGSYFCPRCQAA